MKNERLLQETAHRPYPIETGPWIMHQVWYELLFAHWPLSPQQIRPLVPTVLDIDMFEGETWIGIVPFRMSDVHPRGLPAVPSLSNFLELNVRVYVTYQGRPGVYFFSLDASNPIAVALARTFFHLPYMNARMQCQRGSNESIQYASHRTHRGQPAAELNARYRPTAPVSYADSTSLASWFTERYCLYTTVGQHLYRAEIHHIQWPLQAAELEITTNTMAQAHGIQLPDTSPQLHYSERQDVLVWPLRRLT